MDEKRKVNIKLKLIEREVVKFEGVVKKDDKLNSVIILENSMGLCAIEHSKGLYYFNNNLTESIDIELQED